MSFVTSIDKYSIFKREDALKLFNFIFFSSKKDQIKVFEALTHRKCSLVANFIRYMKQAQQDRGCLFD